ncbi:MAG: translation initiation factor IF-2 [Candidatus Izemoplasmatales bacterium]|jgi:translation initiation factor IF-2|nr:translation initiation factor IF-2 [Candidatus Izemoplasmatales bacterium]MDD4595362.1 translation initiation factor IF-2 [Candidatus Izemoplasmatales bacterium]
MALKKQAYKRKPNTYVKKKPYVEQRKPNIPVKVEALADVIYFKDGMTVLDFAEALHRPVAEIVKKLMFMKILASQTQTLDREIVELLTMDYGLELKDEVKTDMTKFEELTIEDDPKNMVERPAVVTIMGHVDHGKTTLLDTIRHSRITAGEAGGITQHIGAYQVSRNGKSITFIDTPGHAAFTEMRARGAKITDIVILVVAADDGVMPQTKEALDHARAAKSNIIVAVNKMDKPSANPDRVKQELADLDLLAEDWGGSVPFCSISALKGTGVNELLDTIQLVAEMMELKANPSRLAVGSVIEAKLDKGKGPVATLLVSNGTLRVGDAFVVGTTYGKIRAMNDDLGRTIVEAKPSTAVVVYGLNDVPMAGDAFMVFADEKQSREIALKRSNRQIREEKGVNKTMSLEDFFKKAEGNEKVLRLIIKADTQGSIEAFKGAIDKIKVEGTSIDIVRSGVGAITDTDVSLAEASDAIIIGFDVRPQAAVRDTAATKGVEVRLYDIIYEALDDIEKAMKGMLDPVFEKKMIGEASVRETFTISKVGTIAGCMVTSGIIKRDSLVKIIRDGIVIHEGKMSSLKRFKDDVKEVKTGYDCGIMIESYNDLKVDDVIEASEMQEVKSNA